MSNYPQYFLKYAIAAEGDKTIPPELAQTAGTGRLSQQKGWGEYNSLPIGEGGIPPKREDFNGGLFLLSQFLLWYQQGGIMQYTAALDYEPGNEIFHNGVKYRCLKATGPASTVVAPGTEKVFWRSLDAPSVIAGMVAPFYKCSLGGSDGRRLVPWGSTEAIETYVICDGQSDGMGGTVPNLIDKFILPSTVENAGKTGGSLTGTTDSKKISGTVGETTLTVDQMPAHSHSGSTTSAGSHSHTKGTMNIQGSFRADDANDASGAFYVKSGTAPGFDNNSGGVILGFDAAREWTGSTSYDGAHSHGMSLNNTGGGKGHTHTLEGAAHSHNVTVEKPPFYQLAFFVKLSE